MAGLLSPQRLDGSSADRLSDVYVVRAPAGGGRKFRRCRLDVSVGQHYHEGEKLKATIDWVNRYARDPFESCDILVVDSLQRHTLSALDGLDPTIARATSVEAGAAWLARNRDMIDALTVPVGLLRWDSVIAGPRFHSMRTRLAALADSEPRFGDAIAEAGKAFLARAQSHGVVIRNEEILLSGCRDYLIEEMAVIAVLQEDRPAIDCYPGTWLPFQAIKMNIAGVPNTLRDLDWVQLRFKRRPACSEPTVGSVSLSL